MFVAPRPAPQIPPGLADHPRYKISGELGAGGMGVVYKAEDQLMGRVVALKVVAPHLTAKKSAVDRFRKEVRAAAKLNHQNIVTAHDTGEAGGFHFLVMEFVEGTSLDRLVEKNGPLPVMLAVRCARQVAMGLQHAQERGMVHRDIKPQNLMVTKKGQVKIMDFGLARFASTDEDETPLPRVPFGGGKQTVPDSVTNPNLLMGTPDYLSPEQAKNSHDVDPRSDVYSLGCTLYFLLTGRPPFAHARTLIDKLLAHTGEEPAPVRQLEPEVPEGLAGVIAKMMAKEPADRYQTAAEAAVAIFPFGRTAEATVDPRLGFEVIDAVVIAPPAATVPVALGPTAASAGPREAFEFDTPSTAEVQTEPEVTRPRKKKSRKRTPWWRRQWALMAAAAVLAFGLVAAVVAAAGKKKAEPEPEDDPPAAVTPPAAVPPKPAKAPKILYVLPTNGLWLDDYLPVRERLEKGGAKVVAASWQGGFSRVLQGGEDKPGRIDSVPVDLKLTPETDLKDYAAVVFCGERTDEYDGLLPSKSPGAFAASQAIEKMKTGGKVLAAMCNGEKILAAHGGLKGKKAAYHGHISPLIPRNNLLIGPIEWKKDEVVADGKVVTAASPLQAGPFADAILKAIKSE